MDVVLLPGAAWGILLLAAIACSTYIAWSLWAPGGQSNHAVLSPRVPPRADPRPQTDLSEHTSAPLRPASLRRPDANDTSAGHTNAATAPSPQNGRQSEETIRRSDSAVGQEQKRTSQDDQTPRPIAANRTLGPEEYTVGWICAIDTEYLAAQVFLDEEHEGSEQVSQQDYNDCTLGSIGKHNIVIAVLPQGQYGISSATDVATHMLRSFPNLRIGLMVGVGGCAPSSNHDIRLGDVVVSATGNGQGGMIQYDFGKTIQDQEFRETGFLNKPPTFLQTAVHGLKVQYEKKGHQLDETIHGILEKSPRLQSKYERPDSHSDRLYKSRQATTRKPSPTRSIPNVSLIHPLSVLDLIGRIELPFRSTTQ